MNSLVFLWEISLLLCAVGALALAALIAARVIANRSLARREADRTRLFRLLLAGEGELAPEPAKSIPIAAVLTSELAELTRGGERTAMLERAAAIGVPEWLEAQLHSRSAQARLSAVETLALFAQSTRQTTQALDDENADVRLGAALALAQREDAPAPAVFVDKLKIGSEEHSLLLVSLMSDLVQRDAGAVAALLFERDIPLEAKIAATDALANAGGEYAPLLAYMAKESAGEPELQPRIFRALGRNGHPAGAEAILGGLGSAQWTVRAAAAEAAGKSGIADAADTLGAMLSDENWWVRYRAGEALLRLGPRGINALRRNCEGENEVARSTAQAILVEGRAA